LNIAIDKFALRDTFACYNSPLKTKVYLNRKVDGGCTRPVVSNHFCTATYYSNPLQPNEPHLRLQYSKCNAAACIKYLLATPPKSGSRPSEGRNSSLKTTTRWSIDPLRKFYAVKFSCIHGGRKYKATGKVRKTSCVLFLSEKKKFVCLLRGQSALRPTFLCNEWACVSTRYNIFCSKFCSSWLEVVACSQGNCGANVWKLKSCM